MNSWVPGAALVGIGVGWQVLRLILSRTRGLSTLSKPLRAIRYLPIVGLLWRFFPQLLMVGGIVWIVTAFDDEGSAPAAPASLCGATESRPESIAEGDWSRYRCRGEAAAGDRWDRCLRRSRYTDLSKRGCPGAERCCP
jgi:hypothetical protein